MALNIGRKGKLFAKIEAGGYGVSETLAAINAVRHIDLGMSWDPYARVTSPEKKQTPGPVNRFDRRSAASFNLRSALLRPSGTLNTLPEIDPFLQAGFGSKTNVTLSTTCTPKAVVGALAGAGAGNVDDGAHEYYVAFTDAGGQTKVSAATTVTVVDKVTDGKVAISAIPIGPTGTLTRELFRTAAGLTGVANAQALASVADNVTTTYEDNTADAGLGAALVNTDASGLLTTTGGFVADAGALAVGDGILITRNSVRYARKVTAIATTNLTWAPALPTAVIADEAVKGAITYTLTTDLSLSLTAAHYLTGFKREQNGIGIDRLSLIFDGTEEARIAASGPAKTQLSGTTQAEPASFTTVGGNPPTGMVGELYLDAVLALHKTLSVELTNNLVARHIEAGTSAPSEMYRGGRREIAVSLETFAETEADLYDLAEAGTPVALFRQNGRTEGNIVAVYAPRVEFQVPETSDDDEAVNWPFSGVALESADGQNDELTMILA